MRILLPLCLLLLPLLNTAMNAAEYVLVRNGEVRCAVVRPRGATSAEIFAAKELAEWIGAVTGTGVEVVRRPVEGRYNLFPGCTDNPRFLLPAPARKLAEKIRHDGFALHSDETGLYIAGRCPRGVLFGVYEVLKRCGGIRWIHPGPEGTFFKRKSAFSIPAFSETVNPSFQWRRFNLIAAANPRETPLWQLRNNMIPHTRDARLAPEVEGGGHIFSRLLPDSLFREKPELFGLYGGRRLPQDGQKRQPCTSNPETVRIMCENLVRRLKADPSITLVTLLNNDSPRWCECESCRKLDPPEERARGQVPTRYWTLANALIEAGRKAAPHVTFFGSAYQNYHEVPSGVAPSRHATLLMAGNTRCYTHNMFDRTCIRNERFRRILEGFEKTGIPITTYEYMNFLPCGSAGYYIPLGRYVARELKEYHRRGYAGWCDEVLPFDGDFLPGRNTKAWQKNILDEYIKACFLWNADADYDAVEDDAGSRYYGPAWKAMKPYRKYLADLYENLNDHFWMGSKGIDLGKALEKPGAEETLEKYLALALKLAENDPRVRGIVEEERRMFRNAFVERHAQYRKANEDAAVVAAPAGNGLSCGVKYADYAPGIPLELRFLYDEKGLHLVHGAGGPGAELEVTAAGGTERFNVEEAGEKIFPYPGARTGGTLPVGILFRRDGKVSVWNGAENAPPEERLRLISFGAFPVFGNGSFEIVRERNGRRIPADFSGDFAVIEGGAAAGRRFLRGRHIAGALSGLSGHVQTYGIRKVFRGRLKFSVMARGTGNLSVRLSDHLVPKDTPPAESRVFSEQVSSDTWKRIEWEMDCSKFKGVYPLMVLHFIGLDLDCLDAFPE